MLRHCRKNLNFSSAIPIFVLISSLVVLSQTAWVQETESNRESSEIAAQEQPEEGFIVGSADQYEEDEKKGIIVFTGNVRMIRRDGYLYADVVTVYKNTETDEVIRTIAERNVDMKEKDLIAKADKAVLDEAEDTIELTGNVTVIRGTDRVEAPYVKYDRKTGKRIGKGGVRFKVKLNKEGEEKTGK